MHEHLGNAATAQMFKRTSDGGAPLDAATQTDMERGFGTSFDAVRVHTGPAAAADARNMDARAYTVGNAIVFGEGSYAPESSGGRALIAHELAHTVQQRGGNTVAQAQRISASAEPLEREADAAASRVLAGERVAASALSPAHGVVQRAPAGAPSPSGPVMSQGPIGDVIVRIPDWEFFEPRAIVKLWPITTGEHNLLTVPIPELGVRLNMTGEAGASATFLASIGPGTLRNIRLGLSKTQAALVEAAAVLGGPEAVAGLLLFSDFRGLADIEVKAHVGVSFSAFAKLGLAASVLGLFDVATLAAQLTALATADLDLTFRDSVGLYYEDRTLRFNSHFSIDSQLSLLFQLVASVRASLLGFTWSDSFTLVNKRLDKVWTLGTPVDVKYENGATVNLFQNPSDLALSDVISTLLTASQQGPLLQPNTPPAGPPAAPPGGGGGGGGGGAAPAAPTAPTGRTPNDPIDMYWYKRPGLYPMSIDLNGGRYFFTEPEPLDVPDEPGFADVRRNADSHGQITIGVPPASKYYPRIYQSVYPRVRVGDVRGGVKQAQFRRLLAAHGYAWGSQEADHVRDLQWASEDMDVYPNLWPLSAAANNAANRVLDQDVMFQDRAGVVQTNVPLRRTDLGLYFRIVGFR